MVHVFRSLPVERLKLLVFDLDGTLIDSAQDLCNSVNAALGQFGRAPLDDPAIASFVGNGAPMLMRRSLALADAIDPAQVDENLLAQAYEFFLKYYREHKLDFTYAYDGVLEALAALRDLHDTHGGHPRVMAVLTNKPVRPARGICEGLGMADYFLHIYGGDSFPVKKPDPMGLRTLMQQAGAAPEETVMIGDSKVDVETARNAGAWAIGCAFGFGPQNLSEVEPDIVVDRASEWAIALNPANAVR
jgi:haloacid dehalogenase superfamily, subfamily IA, variant 3 with third motif having DD or ED/haloacid dehalogenase superfamily, subfamily IA, variant 1 with third motif having Dx(3-4)D or Dx(3-4)E